MARLARNRFWASRPQANLFHHVTNRGVDRLAIFHSPGDRIVFLSILAAVSLDAGLRIHAFCLMTNHFHLLIEDPRGLLSLAMLRLQTAYARYVRDTTGRRGSGHIFGSRFASRVVSSRRDYRYVVDYVLRNPLETREPLAATAEGYLWSSAAIHIGEIAAEAGCRALVDRFGGVEAVLAALPAPGTKYLERVRRHRMECLVAGEWLEADAARQGRTGAELSRALLEQAATTTTQRERESEDEMEELPIVPFAARFRGHTGTDVRKALERLAGAAVARSDVAIYAMWRFASKGVARIAKATGRTIHAVAQALERIRSERTATAATHEALSRLEWRLTFALGGAPWRV